MSTATQVGDLSWAVSQAGAPNATTVCSRELAANSTWRWAGMSLLADSFTAALRDVRQLAALLMPLHMWHVLPQALLSRCRSPAA